MKEKEIINDFKNHKIKIDVERDNIEFYNLNNYRWLGSFSLETNEFDIGYWLYNNLKKHFKDKDEMYEFSKPFLEKIIGRLLMK